MENHCEFNTKSDNSNGVTVGLMTIHDLKKLIGSNTQMISILGARVAVYQRFVEAVLSFVSDRQKSDIRCVFKGGVENTMALVDDLAMNESLSATSHYHDALLDQTNVILRALEIKTRKDSGLT